VAAESDATIVGGFYSGESNGCHSCVMNQIAAFCGMARHTLGMANNGWEPTPTSHP